VTVCGGLGWLAMHGQPDVTTQPVPAKPTGGDQATSKVFRPTLTSDGPAASTAGARPGDGAAVSRAQTDAPRVVTSKAESHELRWLLADHGVEIPAAAQVIEIDGVAWPVRRVDDLARRNGVPLILPLGRHTVRFSPSDPLRVVTPRGWFVDHYVELAAAAQENGKWSFDRLLELSRRQFDQFADPLVPHFWANYYAQEGDRDAALRNYRWALSIAPTFAPSYFNMAWLLHERGDDAEAQRWLRLAELWNVQNAYGLATSCHELRASIGPGDAPSDSEPDWWESGDASLRGRDRDLVIVLRSAAEFEPKRSERVKILNNIGAYFEHEKQPDRAVEYYRAAAAALGTGRLEPEERRVAVRIFENLTRVCRASNMPEYRRYERLQAMLQP
jgi:hypothetical protein